MANAPDPHDGVLLDLDVQIAIGARLAPDPVLIERAVRAALAGERERAQLVVRIAGRRESRALNRRFRGCDKATNVLAFPAQGVEEAAPDLIGDIVICAPLVAAEAREQGKTRSAHWAHLTVHGVLHLLGFDHASRRERAIMEKREREILSTLGIPDPYR